MTNGTILSACLAAWATGASALLSFDLPAALTSSPLFGAPANDFSCRSSRNPVVMLHGLSLSRDIYLNQLQYELNARGYCTFSLTYGSHAFPSWIGGLQDMTKSAAEIATFMREVQAKTGAPKINIVGHSEGGVQALYVPLTQPGISSMVEHIVSLGPAIHGATYFGIANLWYIGGPATRALVGRVLDLVGCAACEQLAPDGRVADDLKKAAGRIRQDGNKITIVMSSSDYLVPIAASVVDEPGVRNLLVQDSCPDDRVGHGGLATDRSVWRLVVNALEENDDEVFPCEEGLLL